MADRVILGLSGGVDSAVAALLLRQAGFAVEGVALRLWRAVAGDDSLDAARAVAQAVDIPFRVLDLEVRFYRDVVQPFVAHYAQGRTPNPCVACNPTFKFAALWEEAQRVGAAWVATGHYARVEHQPGAPSRLLRARGLRHDQSYALHRLPQVLLQRVLFPLGALADKAEVRTLAREHGLPSAARPDSQDLCFMLGGDYRDLLAKIHPDALRPGPILDETGVVRGEHHGLAGYTVGQRHGLGIAAPAPLYVLRLDPVNNALVVGPVASLEQRECDLEEVTFIAGAPPAAAFAAEARIRYRAPLVPVDVTIAGPRARVTFAQAQRGVAPGQSLVFYAGAVVLGGGVIVA